jgi:hypothetical protein
MSTDAADYLDTQTLSGGDGYFHTENAPTHATDGTATNASPETPLVAASRGEDAPAEEKPAPTNTELARRLEDAGIDVPSKATKAELTKALTDAGLSAE